MNLEFRHEIRGVYGWHEVAEKEYSVDQYAVTLGLREFYKDKNSVLWLMDLPENIIVENHKADAISLAWENEKVLVAIWYCDSRSYIERELGWQAARAFFRKVIYKAKEETEYCL